MNGRIHESMDGSTDGWIGNKVTHTALATPDVVDLVRSGGHSSGGGGSSKLGAIAAELMLLSTVPPKSLASNPSGISHCQQPRQAGRAAGGRAGGGHAGGCRVCACAWCC